MDIKWKLHYHCSKSLFVYVEQKHSVLIEKIYIPLHFPSPKRFSYAIPFEIIISFTDIVSCVSLDPSGHYFISGSYDSRCLVWKIKHHAGSAMSILEQPLQTLYGHDDAVNTVAMVWELDMAVSGSKVHEILCSISNSLSKNNSICKYVLVAKFYF